MTKGMDQGSDMQGTQPRDLRVFISLIASVNAAISEVSVCARICLSLSENEKLLWLRDRLYGQGH